MDDYLAGLGKPDAELRKLVHLYRVPIVEDLKTQVRANIYDQTEVKHKMEDGFIVFGQFTKTVLAEGGTLDLRTDLPDGSDLKRFIFSGVTKGLFDAVAFDSGPERDLALVMEDDAKVLKWLRPPTDQLPIFYRGRFYNVDFVVETATTKFLIEVKARNALSESDVKEKAKSAIRWCEIASGVEMAKKWEYRLVPDDAVKRTSDFHFIIGQAFTVV